METNYYPLRKGWTYHYAYVDQHQLRPVVVREDRTVKNVVHHGDVTTAEIVVRRGTGRSWIKEVRVTPEGVWVDGLLEIKLPLRGNLEWEVDHKFFMRRVLSTDGKAPGISRGFYFERCLEIRAGNAENSGFRIYSVGHGLVREEWSGEDEDMTLVLLDIEKPEKR